jgi:hypothetical protein
MYHWHIPKLGVDGARRFVVRYRRRFTEYVSESIDLNNPETQEVRLSSIIYCRASIWFK